MNFKKRIPRTRNLSEKVIKDAVKVAYGLYRANASYAVAYAFYPNKDDTEVGYGEFVETCDNITSAGYIDLTEYTVHDVDSGEVRTLTKD